MNPFLALLLLGGTRPALTWEPDVPASDRTIDYAKTILSRLWKMGAGAWLASADEFKGPPKIYVATMLDGKRGVSVWRLTPASLKQWTPQVTDERIQPAPAPLGLNARH